MKSISRIILAMLGPFIVAALFAVPALFFHAQNSLRFIIYLGEITGALLLIFRYHKTIGISIEEFGLRITFSWSYLIWSMLYLIVRVAAWVVLIPQTKIAFSLPFLLIQAVFFLLLNAMGEELHFRGLLFSILQYGKPARAILFATLLSSGLFAVFHLVDLLTAGWIWFLPIAADGLALCAIRIKTKSIFWPVLIHGLLNLCTGALFVGAHAVDDTILYAYIITVIAIDLLFFAFTIIQKKQEIRVEQSDAAVFSQNFHQFPNQEGII